MYKYNHIFKNTCPLINLYRLSAVVNADTREHKRSSALCSSSKSHCWRGTQRTAVETKWPMWKWIYRARG